MRSCRVTLTWLLVLAALVLSVPAAAIASGPSAGDNQYTDPLAGQGNHTGSGGSHTSTGSTPTSTPAPTPTPSSSSGSPTTSFASSSPTPTTVSTTANKGTSAASSSHTLPNTGFEPGLGAAIGASLIGVGMVTRRRILCSGR